MKAAQHKKKVKEARFFPDQKNYVSAAAHRRRHKFSVSGEYNAVFDTARKKKEVVSGEKIVAHNSTGRVRKSEKQPNEVTLERETKLKAISDRNALR